MQRIVSQNPSLFGTRKERMGMLSHISHHFSVDTCKQVNGHPLVLGCCLQKFVAPKAARPGMHAMPCSLNGIQRGYMCRQHIAVCTQHQMPGPSDWQVAGSVAETDIAKRRISINVPRQMTQSACFGLFLHFMVQPRPSPPTVGQAPPPPPPAIYSLSSEGYAARHECHDPTSAHHRIWIFGQSTEAPERRQSMTIGG